MAEFRVIESQEELDSIVKDRLDRAKAKSDEAEGKLKEKITKLEGELEASVSKANALSEKLQGHESEVAALNAKIASYELQGLKHQIAHDNGLPYELAGRLKGETEEEIKADAESLKQFVGQQSKAAAPPLATAEIAPGDETKAQYKKLANELAKKF